MRDYDELEDEQDDFEQWAAVHDMIRRDAKKQLIEDLKSVNLTPNDLGDLSQEWDDLVRDAAHPERAILKRWAEGEQEDENEEHEYSVYEKQEEE